jgi:glyceraldehyde 3-phosphate dehydrogenase
MPVRVAINGFGRIGRAFLRCAQFHTDTITVVAVNDLEDERTNAALIRHDSVYRSFPGEVSAGDGVITIDGHEIRSLTQPDPLQLPWDQLGVDVVIESTGVLNTRARAASHLRAGARKVVISGPAVGPEPVDATVVLGVNFDAVYDPARHDVISNGSRTANCLAPVAMVLNDAVGIAGGHMTTVHAFTNDQRLLDGPHPDLRLARAAPLNVVPTSTAAAGSIGLVIPELDGLLDGFTLRVPTANGSLLELTVQARRATSIEEINAAFARRADQGTLAGILAYTDEPYVSSDVIGSSYSAVFDSGLTGVVAGDKVRVVAWYDNEWGYASRLVDLAARLLP